MAQSFRFYGPAIGEPTAIVDADVAGVTLDGQIEFTPQDGSLSAFQLSSDRLSELVDDNRAYKLSSVDTSGAVWKALEDVETHYEQASGDGSAFVDAAEILFRGAAQ